MFNVEKFKPEIVDLCIKLGVKRLDIFGSATGSNFRSDSDIDVLVRFERSSGGLFDRYFELKEKLEEILERRIDIVIEDSIKNPYFKKEVARSRRNIYAA